MCIRDSADAHPVPGQADRMFYSTCADPSVLSGYIRAGRDILPDHRCTLHALPYAAIVFRQGIYSLRLDYNGVKKYLPY